MKFGHRGVRGSTRFIENTIGALKEALAQGAQGLEFDVRLSKDGVLVLMHDAAVDRTMNGKGDVADMTLAELKELNEGDAKVPTLEEVIDLFAGRCPLSVEIVDRGIAPQVKDLLLRKGLGGWDGKSVQGGQALISAFDADDNNDFNYPDHYSSWAELARMRPEFPIALLARKAKLDKIGEEAYIDAAVSMGAAAVHPENIAVTPELVQMAHSKNLKVRAFSSDLNGPADAKILEEMGADGIFYDFPGV
jgi:glycerophosphoryl diester phosphodiesterase